MWQNGFWHMSPLPGSKSPQSLMSTAAPWSLLLAEYSPAGGQVTHAAAAASGCPQTNPQCILRSPVFPHWKSHKVPLASTSLWLLDKGRQSQTQHSSHIPDRGGGKTPHPSALICGTPECFSSSTLSVPAMSPAEGGKDGGWAEALSQRSEGLLNQKGCGSAPALLKRGG